MSLRQNKRRPVDIDFTLRRVFGKKAFRPLQREVIEAAIAGHDVFLQAATSFGKSLCFQLPAIVGHGVTVVVSPLLALMVDQVAALEANGIPVATINSTTPLTKRREIVKDLLSGHPITRLLYVTPEYCQTDAFRRNLQTVHLQGELARIAIDEAHCVSEWGHDFRPAYKELSWFRRELRMPFVPITALTATATARVRSDIISLLGLDPMTLKKFSTGSARPNIHYEVRYLQDCSMDPTIPDTDQLNDLFCWLSSIHSRRIARFSSPSANVSSDEELTSATTPPLPPMTGIIYVPLRAICSELANSLSASPLNIKAVAYHAGLSASERSRIQSLWSSPSKISTSTKDKSGENSKPPSFYIVVATNAFGMGIDNPHVRFVIHWTPPRSFEGFVQESGRAGRDGRAAVSLIYYSPQERDRVLDRINRDQEWHFDAALQGNNNPASKKRSHSASNIAAKVRNQQALFESFKRVVKYCETTTRCRHEVIREFFDERDPQADSGIGQPTQVYTNTSITSTCDFACDFCKEGREVLTRRKKLSGASETSLEDYENFSPAPIPMDDFMGFRTASLIDRNGNR
ncbi:RecQ family helicase RecQ [Blastomyces gilchristii SLH14081]|uniref:ATP-dependent DNA helicase n=1 Tax=Blastomyces gilchristii (strain SLH14081) TaxID=559298 RepID=A0A179UEI5_BLAGS|nr:RecQ family helicase RecQ [Blastomyces gilchristii SLH14081]OAT06426.1 RecQ family helicase RecQ [Blastomyces gilchristii SLH14081]